MKVLLFSNDLMPFGKLPTSGGGLRCYQLMRGLESRGVEVIASMPGFTYLAEKHAADIPEEQREWLWQWHTQDDLLQRAKPDAVLFASNWDHINLNRPFDIPLIVDLHGSRLIETTMWNNPINTDQKVKTFGRADCLLCAGERQRSYFYGWLVQAGRVPADEHFIRYIPISLSPELPKRETLSNLDNAPCFVSGGGWFPWQNQSKAIFAICREIEQRNRGQIRIFGTPHDTATISAEEAAIREIYARVKQLSEKSERIRVEGYIGREDLIDIYRSASLAVEAMEYNLERELAFTTRTIEYLWCGLPVLYNNYAEISDHIRDYDAGWAINPTSEKEINETIEEIFSSPEKLAEKSRNAQRLVQDRFSWDKTIEPLYQFLLNPQKASAVSPVLGTVLARPSFLSPRGRAVEVGVPGDGTALRQHFTMPAENISSISVPISIAENASIESVYLAVKTLEGSLLASRSIRGAELVGSGPATISFPSWRAPKGGTSLMLEFSVLAREQTATALFVQGLLEPRFPFVVDNETRFVGKNLLGETVRAKALAMHFIPGNGRVYRVRLLTQRAMKMIRDGEWRRLAKAFSRRIPQAIGKVRQFVGQQ